MNIAGIEIGPRQPCRVVAEISNNHNGSYKNAVRLLEVAKHAGADFAKLQCYTPDELVALRGDGPAPEPWGSQGWTMRKLYEKAITPRDWFQPLFNHAERIGLPLFASVFGLESLAMLELLGCPAYKIAALDNEATDLVRVVRATGKPVIISVRESVPLLTWALYPDEITLLLCPEGYPQAQAMLSRLRSGFHGGYSYHGTNPLVPAYAVVAGAHMVECHIQLDDEPSELEKDVSLTASDFAYMVREIRRVEAWL